MGLDMFLLRTKKENVPKGSTAYNADYYKDLLNTIDILKGTLETTDFKTQTIFYSSSW